MKISKLSLMLLFFSSFTQQSIASPVQSIASIQEAVNHFIASSLNNNTDYKIRHSLLDKRLRLSLCSKSLDIFSHTGFVKPGRNSIGVKCEGEKRWTIYTSINISIYKNVIVVSQVIRRGTLLKKSLLQFEKRDISTLRSGFITSLDAIIDKQATRNLPVGTVITQSSIVEAKIIRRGEKVYITSSSPNLNITMAGIAMMDGIKGQRIRVKNLKSQQIVLGTVTKPGQIVVLF